MIYKISIMIVNQLLPSGFEENVRNVIVLFNRHELKVAKFPGKNSKIEKEALNLRTLRLHATIKIKINSKILESTR